jgi:hypothetical protein
VGSSPIAHPRNIKGLQKNCDPFFIVIILFPTASPQKINIKAPPPGGAFIYSGHLKNLKRFKIQKRWQEAGLMIPNN